MRARILLAVGAAGCGALAASGVACLGDLPDATSPSEAGIDTGAGDGGVCPPPAQQPAAGDCANRLTQDRGLVCPDDASAASVMRCFAGNRSCACVNGECSPVNGACFATGCPPAVVEALDGGTPSCTPLISTDVYYETDVAGGQAYAPCYCTCEACAAACDGVGSIIASGSQFLDSGAYVPISFTLGDHLPQTGGGRLGFYTRLRIDSAGQGGAVFATFGVGSTSNVPRVTYLVLVGGTEGVQPDGQFHDLVFYEGYAADGGPQAVDSWSSPATGPHTLLLTPVTPQTIIEVDCVIPFFLPE